MSELVVSHVATALARYYAHRYGQEVDFVVESVYRHFTTSDTEFSEDALRAEQPQAEAGGELRSVRVRRYYGARYSRDEAEVEKRIFLTFARADTEFSAEAFWAYYDREIEPQREPRHAKRRAELERHFPPEAPGSVPTGFVNSIRNLRRENDENQEITRAFSEKISSYRCPYYSPRRALRGVHPKSYGIVEAIFAVDDGSIRYPSLPKVERVGLFTQLGSEFRCKLRYSGSGGLPFEVKSDTFARQSHGLALKLLDARGDTLHDFLFNNGPVFPSKEPRSAIPIRESDAGESTLQHVDAVLALASDPGQALLMDQYSISAYAWGAGRAVKYAVLPHVIEEDLLDPSLYETYRKLLGARLENYRGEALAFLLEHARREIHLGFCVQFAEPSSSPIDDETVLWPGPWQQVATLRIPPQRLESRADSDEDLVFSSYQISSREHLPLGRLNRARLWAYQASAKARHEHNQVPSAPHPYRAPQSLKVAVLGGGAAGLSAALALSEFGYQVEVFEKRPSLGGHACTKRVYGGQHLRDPAFGAFRKRQWPNFYALLKTLGVEPISLGQASDWFDSPFIGWFRQDGETLGQSESVMEEGRRFAAVLTKALRDPSSDGKTVGELVSELGLSRQFLATWFMGGVILYFGGHPLQYYLDYPLRLVAWMWQNSIGKQSVEPIELLRVKDAEYMQAFQDYLTAHGVRIHTGVSATVGERTPEGVRLTLSGETESGAERAYGRLVLAIQPQRALDVLGEFATAEEREVLSGFHYTTDEVVVHQDLSYLPKNRADWKLANIRLPPGDVFPDEDQTLPYTLQLPCDRDGETITLASYDYAKADRWPDDVDRFSFQHVQVTPDTQRLRQRLAALDGSQAIFYCGSWTRGLTLHEDAVVSGLRAANKIMAPFGHFEVLTPPVPLPEPFEAGAASADGGGLGRSREEVRGLIHGLLEDLVEIESSTLHDGLDVQGLGLSSLHFARFANGINEQMPPDADEEVDITMLLQLETLGEVVDYVFALTDPGLALDGAGEIAGESDPSVVDDAPAMGLSRRAFVAGLDPPSPGEEPLPRVVAALLQFLAIAGLFGAIALAGTSSFCVASWLYSRWGFTGGAVAIPATWLVYGAVYCALAVTVKWSVVGRLARGRYPINGPTHLRWWTANLFLNFAQQSFLLPFRDSYLAPWLLRLLGARVHSTASLNIDGLNPAVSLVDADLLELGKGAYVRRGAMIQAHLFLDGQLVLAPVFLGDESVVWTRAVVEPGSRIEERGWLDSHSVLSMGNCLAAGERARGVVAESLGPHSQTGVHSTGHVEKTVHTFMGALLLPFMIAAGAALFRFYLMLFVSAPTLRVFDWRLWVSLWPVFILTTVTLCVATCILKWLLVGRLEPNQAEEDLGVRFAVVKFVSFLMSRAVLFCPRDLRWLYLRGMGAKVAFGSVTDCPLMEVAYADLLTMESGAFFSPAAFVDFAAFRDGKVVLGPVHLEPAAYAGAYATLSAPVHLPSFSLLAAASALDGDSTVQRGDVWVGSPAKSAAISLGEAKEESHSLSGYALLKNRLIDLLNHYFITLLLTLVPLLGYHLFAGQIVFGNEQIHFGAYVWRSLAVVAFGYLGNTFFLLPILRADTELLRWLCASDPSIRTEGFERDSWKFNIWHLMSNHLLPYGLLIDLYAGTPLQNWLARRLGARVGKGVYLANGVGIREFTFTQIADGVMLNRGAALIAHSELPNGRIIMKDIALESGSCIAYNSYVVAGTVVPAGALLGSLSRPFEGQELERDSEYNNTPCKRR